VIYSRQKQIGLIHVNRIKLKNIILFFIVFLSAFKLLAQQQIYRHHDNMTGEAHYLVSEDLVVKSVDEKSCFRLYFSIKPNEENTIGADGIITTSVGIGNCYMQDKLILLFENGEKISFQSWNEFNCQGSSYFLLSERYDELLKSQKLTEIRFENGYSSESLTKEIYGEDQNYFIEVYKIITENKIIDIKE
jgi:hypothetical protein